MFKTIFEDLHVIMNDEQLASFIEEFNSIHGRIVAVDGAIEALRQIKEMGVRTCVLTDSFYPEKDKWNWFKSIGMDVYLDVIVTSYDIHNLKDTAEAFGECLQQLSLSHDEVVFVGHKQYEMDGAKKANVTSIAIIPISEPNFQSNYYIQSIAELPKFLQEN